MFLDTSDIISRLDTIVMVLAILSSLPIFIYQKKYLVLVYAAINIGMIYLYINFFRDTLQLYGESDYFADNTISFLFVAITAYNILSINNRALEHSEISNNALLRANDELLGAMEELTAANEEFEAQNEELMRSEEALKDSLNEKIILIKEIHHRVKNNMQVISSLLNMQADTLDEPIANQALKDAVGRIHSMASIHERIYSTDNFSRVDMAAYIDELSRDLVALHSSDSGAIQITPDMKPVFMGIDRAIPCGLLINEILTNSIKHGCREADPCRIDLGIEESGGRVTIVIADHGPGMCPELYTAEQKTSMGMQIIDALARQINATVQLDVSRGTSFTIRIPSEA